MKGVLNNNSTTLGLWLLPSETKPQFLGSGATPDICSGRKTVHHPRSFFSDPTQPPWPPSSVFYSWTLYSTVLYLGHCVSFFLEYIMLQNASLSYFLKWIATEAEFCCKNRQSRTFCNARLPASKPSDGEEFQR